MSNLLHDLLVDAFPADKAKPCFVMDTLFVELLARVMSASTTAEYAGSVPPWSRVFVAPTASLVGAEECWVECGIMRGASCCGLGT